MYIKKYINLDHSIKKIVMLRVYLHKIIYKFLNHFHTQPIIGKS